jgi:hypothetical protein
MKPEPRPSHLHRIPDATGLDYIELWSVHHGEWWQMQKQEYRAPAAALSASDSEAD